MSPSRSYALAVIGGVVAGGVAFFATSRAWSTLTVRTTGMPTDDVLVKGTDAVPLVSAMALVALAGSVAVLASSGRVRLVVGVIIVAASVTALVDIVVGGGAIHDAMVDQIRSSPSMTGGRSAQLRAADGASGTPWRWIAFVSMLAAAAVGVLVVRSGRTWPTMGRKYDAPAAAAKAKVDDDPWKALDRGEDPTV